VALEEFIVSVRRVGVLRDLKQASYR